MITTKLAKMPYANARVEITEERVTLISYTTPVAIICIENGERYLTILGLYSATTRRHISAFVRQFCGIDYATARSLYENNNTLNLDTGELFANS